MRRIGIGMPLSPGVHVYEEGIRYNYTFGGHDLTIARNEPDSSEVNAVQKRPAWFAIVRREDAIFILSKFGDLPWKAAPYNWWINPPVMRPDPWVDMERLGGGVAASVCLVNAANGILVALRTVRWSQELSRMLIEIVQTQMRPPFDPWRYLEVVEQICRRGFNPETLLSEASCMCLADLPSWYPFDPH